MQETAHTPQSHSMLELAHIFQYLAGQVQNSGSAGPSGKPHEADILFFCLWACYAYLSPREKFRNAESN